MKVPIGNEGVYVLDTASWRTHRPVIDKAKCIGCGFCIVYCPVNCYRKNGKEMSVDLSYCKGCGVCRAECPRQAIDWVKEDN